MKVKELIAKLNKHDQERDVLCFTEEEGLLADGHIFRLLDIESVDANDAEQRRGEDSVPTMKLGKSDSSRRFVFLHVVGDF